ncbi:MAG TPA: glycosyltransferase family 61 protein [Chitinophagaceae bacterium]|nr:glycosyltransferase family 61 protein [Chitinophagaceae bacterium]
MYVSRRKANQRKVLNEDQVTEKLKAGGYYIAELEKLPWAEQVNIFRHCRKLVAVHGAGLSNALFMPRGSAMIEIYPKSRGDEPGTNPCYQTLCGDLGHHHVYLFAAREKPDSKPDFHSDNMVVDLAGLDALVR